MINRHRPYDRDSQTRPQPEPHEGEPLETVLAWGLHEFLEDRAFRLQGPAARALQRADEYRASLFAQCGDLQWDAQGWDDSGTQDGRDFSMRELTSSRELLAQGLAGQCAIFCLSIDQVTALTVEVDLRRKRIGQARGSHNRPASRLEMLCLNPWWEVTTKNRKTLSIATTVLCPHPRRSQQAQLVRLLPSGRTETLCLACERADAYLNGHATELEMTREECLCLLDLVQACGEGKITQLAGRMAFAINPKRSGALEMLAPGLLTTWQEDTTDRCELELDGPSLSQLQTLLRRLLGPG